MTESDVPPSAPTADRFEPARYLGEILPAQLRMGAEPPPAGTATVQFLITNVPGCEYWYRAVGGDSLEAHSGVHDRPDLTLILRGAELRALSENTLDVQQALQSGHLRVHGDPALLRWLARRLQA